MNQLQVRLCSAVAMMALAVASGDSQAAGESFVKKFQARQVRTPTRYRAVRHLEAENKRFAKSGWIDVVTEFDRPRLTYQVLRRGGSSLVHDHVLVPALEAEQQLLQEGRDVVDFSERNYRLEHAGVDAGGLQQIRVKPLRKDKRLLEGRLLLTDDAELVEVSGALSESPSFWTTAVTVTRRYGWIGDVRVPVSMSSVANVRIAGRSTFSMTYRFETIDGVAVDLAAVRSRPSAERRP